jgi:O-methyltransferase
MEKNKDTHFNKLIKYPFLRLNYFLQILIINYYHGSKVSNLIKKTANQIGWSCYPNEALNVYTSVLAQNKIKGDIAEVGVFRGFTSKIICEAKKDKKLFLFDTFEGLPPENNFDNYFHPNQFKADFDNVKKYLSGYPDVYFFKGLFPKTSQPVKNNKFSFVHIDVDLYQSTLNCLKFFYPRLSKGGIIISHDYVCAVGVKRAFTEFFKDKDEVILELSTTQCLITKQ